MYKALFEDDIGNDIKNMRFAESFRSLQQYYGKIGDNTFLCGRFLNVFPIGPNKVNKLIIKFGKLYCTAVVLHILDLYWFLDWQHSKS